MEDGKTMTKINVLYEDNHIIVVEKPINVLSQGDSTGDVDLLSMVKLYIKEKYKKPGNVYLGLIHRLDRPVGGIMVFARTSKAASRLTKQVQEHAITKKYYAIVHGKLEKTSDILIDYLEKLDNGSTIVSKKGKRAELSYRVIKYLANDDISLVDIELKTGRHHQIRVQFSSRGHAICGDQRYGILDNRQIALYAYSLSFDHPITKERLTFSLKPPKFDYWTKFTL